MSDNLRKQIYNNLRSKETEELLEIWQSTDTDQWEQYVFEIVKEILLERLGYVPPLSIENQVWKILDKVEEHLKNNELNKALSECEIALRLDPNFASTYDYRGEIYEEMGQLENAIADYQKAIQLDPELQDTWESLLSVESELEEAFEESTAKQHLDQALEYANDDEPEKALAECETAKPLMPGIATAYNYLGMILQTIDRLDLAIDSYLKAIQLNPRFYAARENLANARVRWEEEQYRLFSNPSPIETQETVSEFDEMQIPESGEPIPQWLYMDEKTYLLVGWAGHRTRQGRSGYDPLDRDFEFAHIIGVFIRALLDGKYRTRNPFYLFLMICAGFLFLSPLLVLTRLPQLNLIEILIIFQYIITSSLYWMIGIALLTNVLMNMQSSSWNKDIA